MNEHCNILHLFHQVLTFCHIYFFSCPWSFLLKYLYSNFLAARPGKLGQNSQCRTLGISIIWSFISKWPKGKIINSFNRHFWSIIHHPSSRNYNFLKSNIFCPCLRQQILWPQDTGLCFHGDHARPFSFRIEGGRIPSTNTLLHPPSFFALSLLRFGDVGLLLGLSHRL